MKDNKYIDPPGAVYDFISHPNGVNKTIEIALMQEHRFSFYYWFKWWEKTNLHLNDTNRFAPTLISIDWHRDLCPPCTVEKEELSNLDLSSFREVALFSWDKLNHNNDGHILAAAYLNLIGDIYVLCKQKQDREVKEPNFKDLYGNEHHIQCFETPENLYQALMLIHHNQVYFDIDLDYFTESEDPCGGGKNIKLAKEKDIFNILNPNSQLMTLVLEKMEGMTIATEPKWCGGILNSNKIYSSIDSILFDRQLFSGHAIWKHLQS